MITFRERSTNNLFDPWEYLGTKRRQHLESCWAGLFRQFLLEHLPALELADKLTAAHGRPSKDLHVVMGALVLQQLHDLTDRETVESVSFNIAWHYALDIQCESESYLCERTLRTYRRWVIEKELDEMLFEKLTDQLIRAFSIDTSHQRIDSTAVQSAMRSLTRLGILVDALSKFLRELARHDGRLYGKVDDDIVQRFVCRKGVGFGFGKPSESNRKLPEVAQILLDMIDMFTHTSAATLQSFDLLVRVFNEQCETIQHQHEKPNAQLRDPSSIPSDTVQNPSDPDASYNTHRGVGYLLQVVETYVATEDKTKPDLITYVDLQSMTQHDSKALKPALDDLTKREICPVFLLGDSHYGSMQSVDDAASDAGVEMIAPLMPPKGYKLGKLGLEDFKLDAQGVVVECPKGEKPSKAFVSKSKSKIEAMFDQSKCGSCEKTAVCPGSRVGPGGRRRWQYTPERVASCRRRLAERGEDFKDKYRWRAGVEATMSRLKHQMGLGKLRVRGKKSVRYAIYMKALGMNIFRSAAYA